MEEFVWSDKYSLGNELLDAEHKRLIELAADVAAFAELTEAADHAVVGVDLDYEVLGERNGMLMVCVSGTAVKTE